MMLRHVARPRLSLHSTRSLSHHSLAVLPSRASLSRLSPCIHFTPRPTFSRYYSQGLPRGNQGGFPGFSMGQPRQKGDALKEFVSPSRPSTRRTLFSLSFPCNRARAVGLSTPSFRAFTTSLDYGPSTLDSLCQSSANGEKAKSRTRQSSQVQPRVSPMKVELRAPHVARFNLFEATRSAGTFADRVPHRALI